MLSERVRRKRGWEEGEPIALADGQSWHFPLLALPLPLDVEDIVRVVIRDEDDDRRAWALIPLFHLARRLLSRNYQLSDLEMESLLPFQPFSATVEGLDDEGRATAARIVSEFRGVLAPVLGVVRRSPPVLLPLQGEPAARGAALATPPV